jgi:ComF family protein
MAIFAAQPAAHQYKMPLAYRCYRWLWWLVDGLYPPACGGCGASAYTRWCPSCQEQAQVIQNPICPHCGQPVNRPGACRRCSTNPPEYTAVRSWAAFAGPVQQALHRLKYQKDLALGEMLARPLIDLLHQQNWPVNCVTPVPVGVDRLAERGYNQATFLALPVALAAGLPYTPGALKKIRSTRSQVGLNAQERKDNVAGAFVADPARVQGKKVLVIDDVTTTGATIQACAAALLQSGASQVYGLTLARAVSPSGVSGQ